MLGHVVTSSTSSCSLSQSQSHITVLMWCQGKVEQNVQFLVIVSTNNMREWVSCTDLYKVI